MGCPAPRALRHIFVRHDPSSCGTVCCVLVSLAIFATFSPAFGQTLSPEKQALFRRKGELLKEIRAYEQKKAEAQATLAQANSIREMAKAVNQMNDADVAAQAVEVAQQAISTAEKNIAVDQRRLDAINVALTWHDSVKPRAVATIVRGHVSVETRSGPYPFDPTVPVAMGDHISVGGDGFLELLLQDGTEMHLGPNSDFDYERDVQGVYYQLFRGELHKITIMGVRGANDRARYKGLQAIAAVRGTDFTLEIKGGQDVFTVFEGAIEVDPGGGRDKVVLNAGEEVAVPKSGPVGRPFAFDPKKVSRWWEK